MILPREALIEQSYRLAQHHYARLGVDTDAAIEKLLAIPISLQCWQGDDVAGFEDQHGALGGGLAVTGSHPGKANNADQLRADLNQALALIPGRHRVNLHASYAETGGQAVARNQLLPGHFDGWIDWAREQRLGLDFNPTFFSHPLAADGFTLSHQDAGVRQFWIEHGLACRQIGAAFGAALGSSCVTNVWIPDGYKDTPIDRRGPRERLAASLDAMFAEAIDPHLQIDALEGKLFGLGSESYVVGSYDFYLGYAISRKKMLCLDAGHFHPTESLADKLSAVLISLDQLLLHVSRGVRWDSDHVVTFSDDLQAIAQELVRGNYLQRVRIGLDFFDASINRVAAWVIGARATLKALLAALLEPLPDWAHHEAAGDWTARLIALEEQKTLPLGAIWNYLCLQQNKPADGDWLSCIRAYESRVLAQRGR